MNHEGSHDPQHGGGRGMKSALKLLAAGLVASVATSARAG